MKLIQINKKMLLWVLFFLLILFAFYYLYVILINPDHVGFVADISIQEDGTTAVLVVDEDISKSGIYKSAWVKLNSFRSKFMTPEVGDKVSTKSAGAITDSIPARYKAKHIFIYPNSKPSGYNLSRSEVVRIIYNQDSVGVITDISHEDSIWNVKVVKFDKPNHEEKHYVIDDTSGKLVGIFSDN